MRQGGGLLATAAAMTLVMVACAKGTGGGLGDDVEGGVADDGGETRDVFVVPTGDTGVPIDSSVIPDDASSCTKKVVINELRTDGATASDEFVELYNPSACAVALAGWSLKYESKAGSAGPAGYTFTGGDSIAANSYYLIASATFVGKKDATLMTGFAATDGQVGLLDGTMKVVDAVAYGAVTAGDYREKSPAPSPVSGKSIGRLPNGTDTDSNSADFKALSSSSPGVAN